MEDAFTLGDRVRIRGSQLSGQVTAITDNGQLDIRLDIGGSLTTEAANIQPLAAVQRNAAGQFVAGHGRLPANPQKAEAKANARAIRQAMLTELEPFFANIGTYVRQIPTAQKKIDAIAKLAPYVLPALSRVEFSDQTPRSLTIEQQLVEFTRTHVTNHPLPPSPPSED